MKRVVREFLAVTRNARKGFSLTIRENLRRKVLKRPSERVREGGAQYWLSATTMKIGGEKSGGARAGHRVNIQIHFKKTKGSSDVSRRGARDKEEKTVDFRTMRETPEGVRDSVQQ